MTLFVRINAIEIFPVSCLLGDSVLSQDVVLPRDESVHFLDVFIVADCLMRYLICLVPFYVENKGHVNYASGTKP